MCGLRFEGLESRNLPGFLAPLSFDAGFSSKSVAVGDFDGDGTPDLAVASYGPPGSGGTVSVLLGNGDGTFRPAVNYAVGTNPDSVAVGDFNGDSFLDLAVADYGNLQGQGSGVSVLLGNGDGTFRPAVTYTAYGTNFVAVADLTGDGFLDLVTTRSVLLGNGDGTFRPALNYAGGNRPQAVAVGDFNGDGAPDLAIADGGSGHNGTVNVLLGHGDGTFQPAHTFAAGIGSDAVAVGDFTGDGVLDLAVANFDSRNVSVLLGNGDGTFGVARNYAARSGPSAVVVGDFNGDGIPDLAIANLSSNSVSVLFGHGDGSFQNTPVTYFAGSYPNAVAAGDFSGHGALDLAVASPQGVNVLLNQGDGSFPTLPNYYGGREPVSVAVGDFTGDGIADLAVANHDNLIVQLGNGDGTFRYGGTYYAGSQPSSVAVGDFNGDGVLDLAVTNAFSNAVWVLLGNGNGTFRPAVPYAVQDAARGTNFVAVADLNDDGFLDIVTTAGVLLGHGDGTFRPPITYAAGGSPFAVAVGDFNGDGIPDLAVANFASNNVSVLFGNGDGTFRPAVNYATGSEPISVVVGDFTGNGIQDLAVANNGSYANDLTDASVSVLLGNGDGTFRPAVTYAAGRGIQSVGVGDFTGDGVLDLAVANLNNVSLLRGNGDGTFQTTPVNYVAGTGPDFVAVGDFNGDGLPDLAVASYALTYVSNNVWILLNDGNWLPGSGGGSDRHRPRPRDERALVSWPAGQIVLTAPESALSTPAADISPRASLSPELDVGLLDQLFAGAAPEQPHVALGRPVPRARAWRDDWLTLESDGWPGI